jgi:hypothetical protein
LALVNKKMGTVSRLEFPVAAPGLPILDGLEQASSSSTKNRVDRKYR